VAIGGKIYQNIAYTASGTTTTLRAWLKGDGDQAYLTIKFFSSSFVNLGESSQQVAVTAQYSEKVFTSITAPTGVAWVEISIARLSGSNDLLIDDVCLVGNPVTLQSNPFQTVVGSDVHVPEFLLFPNPAKEYFTVSLPDSEDEWYLEIYDRLGRIKKSIVTKAKDQLAVHVNDFEPGLYFVNINSATYRSKTLKLVIESGK
jgi:Secretion system C-terminal sorting domain